MSLFFIKKGSMTWVLSIFTEYETKKVSHLIDMSMEVCNILLCRLRMFYSLNYNHHHLFKTANVLSTAMELPAINPGVMSVSS